MSTDKDVFYRYSGQEDTLARLRAITLDWILWATVLLGALVAGLGIWQEMIEQHRVFAIFMYALTYFIVLTASVWKQLGNKFRGIVFLLVLYYVGASELWFFGLTSITSLYLFAFVIFAGILLGLEAGLTAFFLSITTLAAVGWLFLSGTWTYAGRINFPLSIAIVPWMVSGLSLTLLSGAALISLTLLLRSLNHNMRSERQLVEGLRIEIRERERAEEAVRRKEEQFRSLIENSSDGVVLTDTNGITHYVSPAAERFLGYPQDHHMGKNVFEDVHPDDLIETQERFKQLLEDKSESLRPLECRLRHKNGTWRTIEAVAKHTVDPVSGGWVIINYRDVTDRNRVAAELEHIYTHARCILWHADVTMHESEYRWSIDVPNVEAAQRYLPLDVRPGQSYFDALVENRDQFEGQHERLCASSTRAFEEKHPSYHNEYACRRNDGDIRWLYEDAYIQSVAEHRWRVVGVCTDITERRQAEEVLRESESELRQVIDLVPHSIYAKDRESRFIFVNRRSAELMGSTPQDAVGKTQFELTRIACEAEVLVTEDKEVL
jgi:PAS domain S-box-containing protein